MAAATAITATVTELRRLNLHAAERVACELDFHEFVTRAWKVLEPHTPFIDNWHIKLICRKLEAVTRGEIQKLIINVPPGTSKSRIVSVFWPCWEMTRRPWLRYQCFSYSQDLSTLHSMERRTLIESDWFRTLWGDTVELKHDHNLKTEIATTSSPGMISATSVGGTATGKGGERLIIDDPLNPKQAASDVELQAVKDWWTQTLPTRLRNFETGAKVLVMQRLHVNDPTALMLAEAGVVHVCLPMEYDRAHPHVCPDDPRTQDGELLCPHRFSAAAVAELKRSLGTYASAGQLEQRPTPAGGSIWKPALIKDGKPTRPGDLFRFNVADLAYSQTRSSDYTAVACFGGDTTTGDLFLLDVLKTRIDIASHANGGAHRAALEVMRSRHSAQYTIVETAAFASRIVEFMRRNGEPVQEVKADRSKVARAMAAMPVLDRGQLWADKQARWWPDVERELSEFRGIDREKNDQADVVAYGCIHWRDIWEPSMGLDLSMFSESLTDYVP